MEVGAGEGQGFGRAYAGVGEDGEEGVIARLMYMPAGRHGGHEALELGVGEVALAAHAAEQGATPLRGVSRPR
jgi:hypothetical protein